MGLSVNIGILAFLTQNDEEGATEFKNEMAKLNAVLRENGLPEHFESETLPKLEFRDRAGGFPYSFLHYLRRVAAYSFRGKDWKAESFPENADPTADPVLDAEMYMFESHLLCHSDCEGYYLPIDFSEVLIDATDKKRIRGGLLGSSYKLMSELMQIAPSLDIHLENGDLPDEEAAKIVIINENEEKFYREKLAWLALFEAARLSIKHRTAIVFQ